MAARGGGGPHERGVRDAWKKTVWDCDEIVLNNLISFFVVSDANGDIRKRRNIVFRCSC
jgi:hypothetical protein